MAQFKDLFTELRRDTGLSQEDFAALFHQRSVCMLIDSIIHAQQGCDSDMMFFVSKFSGILKKYARKLNYEDAEQDLTADFIELIHHIDIEKLNNTSDGAIVNFLIRSTYHYYVKRLQKERDRKVPEVYFEDLTPSQSNLVLVQTAVELEESISGYFPSSGLSEREIFILMAVYTYGYSVSDIAKYLQVSRQNINQIKKRAENKIRQKLT